MQNEELAEIAENLRDGARTQAEGAGQTAGSIPEDGEPVGLPETSRPGATSSADGGAGGDGGAGIIRSVYAGCWGWI